MRFTAKVTVALSVEEWCLWLDYFGGVPAHLKSAAAHRQASEISHVFHATGRVNPPLAMVGLAYAISCESERGRKIRSLGFIAENLIRKAEDNDDTWACDVPHRKSSEFDCAHRFATDVTEALETFHYGIELDARGALTTYRIEHLSNLIRRHGWSGLMDAINYVTENQLRQPEGSLICSWHWFSDYIEPAKTAKVAAAAAATPQNQPQPVKQGAGWDADVEAVCDWLRSHLGDAWHSSLRVSAAAKHAGIDHQIYLAAKAQLGCQKGRAIELAVDHGPAWRARSVSSAGRLSRHICHGGKGAC